MTWLNYHHLFYFWTVAKEGTIAAACQKLRLAQPTVSTQLRVLEQALGYKLFERHGRNLLLTETGRIVYRYANEIFTTGQELMDTLEGRPVEGRLRLRVGIADVLTKEVAHLLLSPALTANEPVQLSCYEGKPAALLAALSTFELDLVLSDSPIPPEVKLKGFNHLLGESSVTVFAAKSEAASYRRKFPGSLEGAPFLLPTDNTSLRRSLDQWFAAQRIRPSIIAEFCSGCLAKPVAVCSLCHR
jgi:LysR family transcriptional activator of nhaA